LSSAYTYVGKLSKGFSGVMVERLATGRSLLEGYALFFIGCGLLGIPALVLCILLARATRAARSAVPDAR
jgi:PAT family beta-lactamase induction signal transducer AmpG